MTTLAELEARVAALEARDADYQAVLAAVGVLRDQSNGHRETLNALGQKVAGFQGEVREKFDATDKRIDDLTTEVRSRFNAVDETLAEIKDLIVGQQDS